LFTGSREQILPPNNKVGRKIQSPQPAAALDIRLLQSVDVKQNRKPRGGVTGCGNTAAAAAAAAAATAAAPQEVGQSGTGQSPETTCCSESNSHVILPSAGSGIHQDDPLFRLMSMSVRTDPPQSSWSNELHELVVAHVTQKALQTTLPFTWEKKMNS